MVGLSVLLGGSAPTPLPSDPDDLLGEDHPSPPRSHVYRYGGHLDCRCFLAACIVPKRRIHLPLGPTKTIVYRSTALPQSPRDLSSTAPLVVVEKDELPLVPCQGLPALLVSREDTGAPRCPGSIVVPPLPGIPYRAGQYLAPCTGGRILRASFVPLAIPEVVGGRTSRESCWPRQKMFHTSPASTQEPQTGCCDSSPSVT